MNIIRQNTDYALRAMVHLAAHHGGPAVSTRVLAGQEGISSQFAAKIMQQLQEAGLVTSKMGPKGGFSLARDPADITLLDVIHAMQGDVSVNSCMFSADACPRRSACTISHRLEGLQNYVEDYLAGVTLQELVSESCQGACATERRRA